MEQVDNIHYDYSTISISVKNDKFIKKYIKEKKERIDPYKNPIVQFKPFQKPLQISKDSYLKSQVYRQPLYIDKVLMESEYHTKNFHDMKKMKEIADEDFRIMFR